ncbi:DUF835 domain-containing protein [Thermococcus sp.]|uniref:DUF835 domain-containing protein n=1 Tax=Thermococcus sp. TaxID=35749 RepID=UPI002634FDCA|nr:DUF835 domain-containing protein [Thermococcus sp.]
MRVSPIFFITDIVLLVVIGYAAIYSLRRVHRYGEPLDRFIVITAVSLLLATVGRFMDVLDDFWLFPGPYYAVEYVLYFLAIVGVAYGLLSYISSVERRIFPIPSEEGAGGELAPGGYLYITGSDEGDFLKFLGKCVHDPVLVITRDPWRYEGLENVRTVWVTPIGEGGVSPTRLHVLLDAAVEFMRGGGKLVVVDCPEILVLYNDFPAVFKFLSSMKDYAISSGSTVLLLVEEGTLDERELNILSLEFTPVRELKNLLKTSS